MAELKHYERMQKDQHFSYDLTQRLTYYVISAELIFCGYVLLNADKFGAIKHSSILFLLAGIAALSGVLWRFGYNQNQHDIAHGTTTKSNRYILMAQLSAYWIYIIVSVVFFVTLLGIGFSHIRDIELAANGDHEKPQALKVEIVSEPTLKTVDPEAKKPKEDPTPTTERESPETKPNNSSKRDAEKLGAPS